MRDRFQLQRGLMQHPLAVACGVAYAALLLAGAVIEEPQVAKPILIVASVPLLLGCYFAWRRFRRELDVEADKFHTQRMLTRVESLIETSPPQTAQPGGSLATTVAGPGEPVAAPEEPLIEPGLVEGGRARDNEVGIFYAYDRAGGDWRHFGGEGPREAAETVFETTAFPVLEQTPPTCRGFICLRHTSGVQFFAAFGEEADLANSWRKVAQPAPPEAEREPA